MESYPQNSNKLDFQHEVRILNSIWLTIALGLVTTAGLAWNVKYLGTTAAKHDSLQIYVAIGLLLLSICGLNKDINKISTAITSVICLLLISSVTIVIVSLAPVSAIIVVFGATGLMFLVSMLADLLFKFGPGPHRFIIMMTLTGLALVIIVNVTSISERPIWVIGCLMIILWSGITLHRRNKLLELTGKSHSEELWSSVRCAFIGALTLYYYLIGFFGTPAAIAMTLVQQRYTRLFRQPQMHILKNLTILHIAASFSARSFFAWLSSNR